MSRTLAPGTLDAWLAPALADAGPDTAVLAGHFAIFSAGGIPIDGLVDDTGSPAGAREMVDFTRATWCAAVEAIAGGSAARLVVLVDDIQFIRPVAGERAMAERLAAALAADYLERTPHLPAYHHAEFHASGCDADHLLARDNARVLFSERELRIAAARRVRRAVDGGELDHLSAVSCDQGNTVTVTIAEQGDYDLLRAGHASCAGGYAELLATLSDRNIRRLIALIPARCLGAVSLGTLLARRAFGAAGMSVTTVAVGGAGTPVVVLDET